MPPRRKALRGGKSSTGDVVKEVQHGVSPEVAHPQGSTFKQQLKHTVYRLLAILVVTLSTSYFKNQVSSLDQAPWKVVDLPGRGKGMIATRLIKQGERIMTERPLFIVPLQITEDPLQLLKSRLEGISPEKRASFFELSYADSNITEDEIPLSIFQTNGISAGGSGVGIFPKTARLNHACSAGFNSVYSWRDDEELLVVHTLKEVQAGEELLTTYFDTKKPRSERRDYLRRTYKFDCSCPVCSPPTDASRASDTRLRLMASEYAKFTTWGRDEINGLEALNFARKVWRLGDEEGYWSERGQLAADAAHVAAAHSDEQSTRRWATLAQEWYGYEVGNDSIQAKAMGVIAEAPQQHIAWATKQRMDVGDLSYD